ncbi:hypothetical protein EJV47_24805 [Hymenobacter gummosus]|uniref:Lipoprotein n=1 Tax=Hymenobacter gummosus TaxID=1776032 RepID=A0A3S0H5S0_9BACT|nr:hypothetical protein [Hymenobacter gummosus]RTQ45709.1 hypothetical protein EJV47_24805 [Hymenobacter gummosus]
MFLRMMAAGGLALFLTACNTTTEAPLEMGKDYYPLRVGAERVFRVIDQTWRNNRVVTSDSSLIREQLTETYRDAAGVLTYQLVRSVRRTSADAWRLDSVQTITVNEKNLLLTRSNLRTVELVFPTRANAQWNRNAFNTLSEAILQYEDFGAPTSIRGRRYDNTVTAYDKGTDPQFIVYRYTTRQVYAKGVGPVYRERVHFDYCQNPQTCSGGNTYIVQGTEHREILLP